MLEVRLLGQFDVQSSGKSVAVPSRPAQSLLAYLILNAGTAYRREQLAGLLWPDTSDERARSNLRHALWRIRKAIEAKQTYLITDDLSIRFDPDSPYWLDVHAVEREPGQPATADELIAALAHYRGELLPGFYDDWVVLERERLQAIFERKIERLLDRLIAAQRWTETLDWGERWIALGQSPEPAYRAMLQAHSASGNMSKVAATFERCVQTLRDDLGVEPSEQTRALYERLKAGKPAIETAPTVPVKEKHRETPKTNLPNPLTSFIGREKEVEEVIRLLGNNRLVTLTGAGGVGKTRLAIQSSNKLMNQFHDGVWWVELVGLNDPSLVPHAAAKSLGMLEVPTVPLIDMLANALCAMQALLVFDNCEHLIAACAQLTESLLGACASLKVLTTSREALKIMGEHVFVVPSLSIPDPKQTTSAQDLMHYESTRLFIERATAVTSNLAVTDQNASAIAQVCVRLDGIPLAIELAAARVKLLSVGQIVDRLSNRFKLLTDGSRTALPRRQTLRAAIDWSYDLLSEQEKILLRRLSVFASGWTLEAAEAVAADNGLEHGQVLELLSHLVDKSLVIVEEQDGTARYRMLETIGQYAAEKLAESVEVDRVPARHLQFYLQLAEESEIPLTGADQAHWLERLDAEKDNFRAALEWALSGTTSEDVLLRFVGALCKFWPRRGYFAEAREWLSRALAQTDATTPTPARAKVLDRAGYLAYLQCDYDAARQYFNDGLAARQKFSDKRAIAESWRGLGVVEHMQGNYEAARSCYEESLTLCREAGDKWGIATALSNLGVIAFDRPDYTRARELFEECLVLRRELDDRSGIAYLLNHLGYVAWYHADYAQAKNLHQKSLTIRQELGDKWGIAYSLDGLGLVAWQEGDYTLAHTCYKESLRLFRELGDAWRIAGVLTRLASLAASQGQAVRATHLLSAAEALRQPIHAQLSPAERIDYERQVELVRAQLDKAAFASAWNVGHAMTMEQAIELALQSGS